MRRDALIGGRVGKIAHGRAVIAAARHAILPTLHNS
jgi:hypothetical protein